MPSGRSMSWTNENASEEVHRSARSFTAVRYGISRGYTWLGRWRKSGPPGSIQSAEELSGRRRTLWSREVPQVRGGEEDPVSADASAGARLPSRRRCTTSWCVTTWCRGDGGGCGAGTRVDLIPTHLNRTGRGRPTSRVSSRWVTVSCATRLLSRTIRGSYWSVGVGRT